MRMSRGLAAIAAAAAAATMTATLTTAQPAAGSAVSADPVGGRNLPADGRVLFLMGQDSSTLSDYKRDVLDRGLTPKPGGVTLYTNLVLGGDPPPLAGMAAPADWGAGRVDFPATLSQYPDGALAVGLYLSDTSSGCGNQPLRAIIDNGDADLTPALVGQYRAKVDEMVNRLKGYGRAVYLRIGYEFDGPWNCYNADFYKKAFRYIKGRIDALGATRVATVWQSAAWPLNTSPDHPEWNYVVTDPNHLNTWYPGDDVVDWVGLSSFYNAGSIATQWGCRTSDMPPAQAQSRILDFARAHAKPAMIAEAAPQGYSTGTGTRSCIFTKQTGAASAETIWNQWYAGFFSLIENNRDVIRAVSYINTDWESQPLWKCADGAQAGGPGCANGYWGDSRVQGSTLIRDRFLAELRKPVYVNGTGTPSPTPTPTVSPTPTPTVTPTVTPTATPTATPGRYTHGADRTAVWFKPTGFTASFVTVHYTVNGGGQLNYFLSWNAARGRWELPVTLRSGDRLSYSFDFQPTGQTYQETTSTFTQTVS
ncbi:endo-1,3-beta-xylanase [Planomonospora venezuelensis]|uniref:Endo-1,3-beta-xylanase n=1 Tax=Planomonospora venezuelensis TaxID=1999 RepID=A0A841D3P4_PLAVE|nr:endo-1,3-beta-xylanase [Planomonospora venezuelensis]MBB5963573.1 hypothetical protein [Planomonospora venezuelensis]GIN02092.1 hypothetical protein Pve01_37500 [Planomonospora venezuelensis]